MPCSGLLRQGAQRAAQTIPAATSEERIEACVRALPNGNGTREERATGARQRDEATASVRRVRDNPDETAPLQGLKRGGQGRAVHRKESRDGSKARRLRSIEGHQERKLAMRKIERPQGGVEAARDGARGALHVQTQAMIANVRSRREWRTARI